MNDRNRAFLVLGPESCGTRLVTEILMAGGCIGNADHYQWWDDHPLTSQDRPVVWRRSYPHGPVYPNLGVAIEKLQHYGRILIQAVVVIRSTYTCARSSVLRGHAPSHMVALAKMQEGLARLFRDLEVHRLPYTLLTYEGLVARPRESQLWLHEHLGLPVVPGVEVTDGDAKHWEVTKWQLPLELQ